MIFWKSYAARHSATRRRFGCPELVPQRPLLSTGKIELDLAALSGLGTHTAIFPFAAPRSGGSLRSSGFVARSVSFPRFVF